MSTKKLSFASLILALLYVAGTAFAADTTTTTGTMNTQFMPLDKYESTFDPRINTWVEGTVSNIKEDGSRLTVHGSDMPYATTYSQMMKDLAVKTQNKTGADRERIEGDVHKAWADKLARSQNEKPGKLADYTFAKPAKGDLSISDYGAVRDMAFFLRPAAETPLSGAGAPLPATAGTPGHDQHGTGGGRVGSFTDLHVGDRVMVGYESGVFTNEAMTIVRETKTIQQPAR
ncbi:MAG TPA: hypothetical protein VGP72_11125 [Planctomycetota bacterium]|jgi:hypothetical protein